MKAEEGERKSCRLLVLCAVVASNRYLIPEEPVPLHCISATSHRSKRDRVDICRVRNEEKRVVISTRFMALHSNTYLQYVYWDDFRLRYISLARESHCALTPLQLSLYSISLAHSTVRTIHFKCTFSPLLFSSFVSLCIRVLRFSAEKTHPNWMWFSLSFFYGSFFFYYASTDALFIFDCRYAS